MKLLRLHIDHFGKLADKNIEFDEGMNIISGENESGKSTLHSFICAMLLGLPRGRGRAAKGDLFSRFKPWDGGVYGGSITFEEDGREYTLIRNFGPDAPSVSLRDETAGRELPADDALISRLTLGLTPTLLRNTISVGQLSAGTGRELADELRSHVVNLGSSGDYSLDVSAAIKDLATQRKRVLGAYNKDAEAQDAQLAARTADLAGRLAGAPRSGAEDAAARRSELEKEICGIEEQIDNDKQDIHDLKLGHPFYVRRGSAVICLVLALVMAAAGAFGALRLAQLLLRGGTEPRALAAAGAGALIGTVGAILAIRATVRALARRRRLHALRDHVSSLSAELAGRNARLAAVSQEANLRDRAAWERERLEDELEAAVSQRAALAPVLESNRAARAECAAIDLAAETLRGISEREYSGFGRFLEKSASRLIHGITGVYDSLQIGEDMELYLTRGGRRVPARSVSAGTLDQVYLALRLACVRFFWKDASLPLLLDDTFAMYDDARLERTLCWLTEAAPGQVLIFSCHTREERILSELGLEYKKISLS